MLKKPITMLILLVLIAGIIPGVHAAYSMMTDIDHVNLIGASCSGAQNGSSIGNSYDGNTATWLQATNCAIAPYFKHNWTVDFCHYRVDGIGTATKHWELYWSGYTASPNATTLYKDGGWKSLKPKKNATAYDPVVLTGQYLAASPGDPSRWYISEWECFGTSTEVPPPYQAVNFTGTPLDGNAPLSVVFTIQNYTWINTTAPGNLWYFGDGETTTVSSDTITHVYDDPGIYTVALNYTNISQWGETITKTNYVLASNPSGLAVNLDIKNAITGALVQDSTVGIQNTTTGVWRNTTAPTGLVYFTSTDPGYLYPLSQNQSITLAANKSGYQDASKTFNIPYNNYREILYMVPTSVINSTGNGTVVVNVIRALNGLTVSGMSVAMDSGQVGITNTAGAVTLFNVSAGERTVTVTDPSDTYLPTEKVFNLSAGETKLVTVYVARDDDPPIDPDDPFTSPTPTPTGTYDPDDPNSPVYGNYTTSEINQQGGAGVMGMLAQLIALWPAIVIFAFLKFMRSAMT